MFSEAADFGRQTRERKEKNTGFDEERMDQKIGNTKRQKSDIQIKASDQQDSDRLLFGETTTSKNIWFHGHRRHKLTSPVLQAEEVVEVVADERRDLLQVVGSNPGCQERLVGISEGGVHQQQPLVGAHGLGESLGTVTQEHVAETHWRLACGEESK